jgi:hypothetical protein
VARTVVRALSWNWIKGLTCIYVSPPGNRTPNPRNHDRHIWTFALAREHVVRLRLWGDRIFRRLPLVVGV